MNNENSQPKTDQSMAGKILLWVLVLLIIGSVGVTYWRIMIMKDYVVEGQIDCDPYENECFVWECDPESSLEGEACTGDPEADTWYFQVARRSAANIPLCDPETDETCDPWTCEDLSAGEAGGEKDCSETFCSEELMEEQYASACVDPVQFAIDNPVEDLSADEAGEEIECEEDDEECLAAQEEAVECEEGDEECLTAVEEAVACEEGDEECLAAQESEEAVCDLEADPTCVAQEEAVEEGGEGSATKPTDEIKEVAPVAPAVNPIKKL